jgi:hypothetical protein
VFHQLFGTIGEKQNTEPFFATALEQEVNLAFEREFIEDASGFTGIVGKE